MRIVAYKQARNALVKNSLPKDYITEWTYKDLQPEGFLKEDDGWNFLPEDQFQSLLNSNNSEEKLNEFRQIESAKDIARATVRLQEFMQREPEKQQLQQEFEEFIQWRKNRNPS